MEVTSTIKFLRMSPRKIKLVSDKMENTPVSAALVSLRFVQKKASNPLIKVIKAAVSDAKNNFKLDESKLRIKRFEIQEGPRLKRIQPVSRGQSHPIIKRTAHIKVVISD